MVASACCRSLRWSVAVWLALGGVARAAPSSQAELTSLLDSGDLLGDQAAGPAQDAPWQSLASLRRGDESRTRLALSTTELGFLPGVSTSALLRLELGLNEGGGSRSPLLRDVSSSLGLAWRLGSALQLTVRAFPFDTDYLRLGYLHALDWGGTDAAHDESVFVQPTGAVPGLRVGLELTKVRLFSAVKWATIDDALRGRRRAWGVLSGGSFELAPGLRAEGGFGYFQRPTLTPALVASASFVEGASLRVVWQRGPAEPELAAEPFRPPSLIEDPTRFDADSRPGTALALEGVALVQRLRRFEDPSASALLPAPALGLYGSCRGRSLAAHAALTWRSLAFVLRNDPRFASGETLPASAAPHPELMAWLGASATLRPLWLVPSVELGLRVPAAVQTVGAVPGLAQTLVAGGPAGLEALPLGAGRLPVLSSRLGARLQLSAAVAWSLFGEYERNPNRVAPVASPSGVVRTFARPDRLSVFSAAQARF